MKTYQRALAYVTIAAALAGCEKEQTPFRLEALASPAPVVVHAAETGPKVDTPEKFVKNYGWISRSRF